MSEAVNRKKMSERKRIVVKVGTSTLTHSTGMLNIRRVEEFVKVLSDLKNSGLEIILVTSGAQGIGVGKLGLAAKPKDIPSRQAVAAIGQCELMYLYDKQFARYDHVVSQVLLTKDVIENTKSKQNVINTLTKLLEFGSLPIINENDTVSYEEIEFGDNDTLSAIVGELMKADLLVILSDVDGLCDKDPNKFADAKRIPEVDEITGDIFALAGNAGSEFGTGGMITKLYAAKIATEAGIDMVIMSGKDPNRLYDLLDDKPVGTVFLAK